MHLVLLPGMDGTGRLVEPFVEHLPKAWETTVVRYPANADLSYEQLEAYVTEKLPVAGSFVVIAESFSGPIGLRLAARFGTRVQAVVLVCTFAHRPLGSFGLLLAHLPLEWIFRCPIPDAVFRALLFDRAASPASLGQARAAIRAVQPRVLAARLRDALTSRYCATPIECSTRIVALCASSDRLLGRRAQRSILEVCRDAEVKIITAPHFALQCAPAKVLRILETLEIGW